MTMLERWAIVALAAATVVVAGAGGTGDPSEPGYQENRDHIEQMELGEKRQLLKKRQRFRKLSLQKQRELETLHRDLQAQPNREELEQVMEAYFEWVRKRSPSEKSQLDGLSPQERIKQVIKYKTSPHRQFGRRDGPSGIAWSPGGRMFGRGGPPSFVRDNPNFFRDCDDARKAWTGRYVTEQVDILAGLLPPAEAEKWKAGVEKARSADSGESKTRWVQLVRWYLAGPKEDLPLSQKNVDDFEELMTPEVKKWFDRFAPDKIRGIRAGLGMMIWQHFESGQPEFANLIPAEELDRFSKSLPRDKLENLKRFSKDKQANWIRRLYFTSKLPPDTFGFREDRGRFGEGGGRQLHGDPDRDGPGARRGPGGESRDRGDGSRGMRQDRPGMQPPGRGPEEER